MLIIELVLKALTRSKSFSFIFILNFSLAIASLSYLQFFKENINSSLDLKAKSLIGADLVISSRFPISKKQIQNIKNSLPKIKSFDQGVSTVSMVASKKRARLMQVVQINKNFPFYGGLVFKDKTTYPKGQNLPKKDEVWVYQELLDLLDLKKGDKLKIGDKEYTIKKVIAEDSLKTVNFSGFIPKIYLSEEALKRSSLLTFGSTARYKLNFLFEENFTNNQLDIIEKTLEEKFDKSFRVSSPNDGKNRLLRVMGFLTNFLSLVSLISFFLGVVGLIYLYSGFLKKHQKDILILNDIGVSKKNLAFTYLLHLFILIFISSIIVFLFIILSSHFLSPLVQKYIDFNFDLSLDYTFFLKAAVVLFILSLSVGLPLILPLIQREKRGLFKTSISFLPFFIFLLLLSHFVSPAKYIGFLFALSVIILILILFLISFFILKRYDFSGHLKNLALSLAIKNITREKKTSITLFIAILLSTTFFSLIPQVGSSLNDALTKSVNQRPGFFILDAKEGQINDIEKTLKSFNAKLENKAAMVRAKIIDINDKNKKDITVNLSYRSSLKNSEKIIKGRDFNKDYNLNDYSKPVELSVEERFANKQKIDIGDTIVFDILGLEIKAVVVNIRAVNWIEFTPNFFLILQKGAIDDVPKTILATISQGDYNRSDMILKLTDKFPNLTIIDVKNLIESFASIVKDITSITEKMSLYSITIGLLISFIIIQYQMNLQKNNILRLKIIGIKNKTIKNSFLLEFGIISFCGSILGIAIGSIASYLISDILFESHWNFRADILALYFLMIPLLTLFVVNLFTSKTIHQKENILFGE